MNNQQVLEFARQYGINEKYVSGEQLLVKKLNCSSNPLLKELPELPQVEILDCYNNPLLKKLPALPQVETLDCFNSTVNFADNLEIVNKVLNNNITVEEVFNIENIEQRRVVYQLLDKSKILELNNYIVLDETIDQYNNKMKIIRFTVDDYKEPFLYLQCICPSTGRKYLLETKQVDCNSAKSASFGLTNINFNKEW